MLKKYKYQLIILVFTNILFTAIGAQDIQQIAKQKPIQLTGNFNARIINYFASGINARRQPFSWFVGGNATLKLYGIDIPFSVSLSEQNRSFSQPFNQFGLSPSYKWITVHAGYRNLSFSPYTLDGYTMLGIGVELKPKKFNFSIMHGRLNRATTLDTTLGTLQPFSFSRKGTAIKMGVGNDRNYISLSAIKAMDDSSSVNFSQTLKQSVRAAANTAASVAIRKELFKTVFFEGDAAVSIYTNDIGSNLPLSDSTGWIKKVANIIVINGTSQFNTAYRAAAGYIGKKFSLKAEYKNISPDYKSMGVYYFNTDIESITINPSFNIKNKVIFNGSIGTQKDNTRKQKEATTKRLILMSNIILNFSNKFGIDINVTNYSANSTPVVVQVQKKYLLTQNNNNLSISPRYVISNANGNHVIVASFNRASLSDKNDQTSTVNDIITNVWLLNYSRNIYKKAMGYTISINKTTNTFSAGTFNNIGATVSVNKNWLKNKLQTIASVNFTNSKSATDNSNYITAQLEANVSLLKPGKLNFRYSLLSNSPQGTTTAQKFIENTFELGYSYSF
ncbi:MAG: hypothetical protein LC122_02955 [Chitinophagales bacterium]|nr:hypothetical protein [Chitinophagales bacterium]